MKRGHTVEFIKPFIKKIDDIRVIIIERGERAFVRLVKEDSVLLKMNRHGLVLTKEEAKEFLKTLE